MYCELKNLLAKIIDHELWCQCKGGKRDGSVPCRF